MGREKRVSRLCKLVPCSNGVFQHVFQLHHGCQCSTSDNAQHFDVLRDHGTRIGGHHTHGNGRAKSHFTVPNIHVKRNQLELDLVVKCSSQDTERGPLRFKEVLLPACSEDAMVFCGFDDQPVGFCLGRCCDPICEATQPQARSKRAKESAERNHPNEHRINFSDGLSVKLSPCRVAHALAASYISLACRSLSSSLLFPPPYLAISLSSKAEAVGIVTMAAARRRVRISEISRVFHKPAAAKCLFCVSLGSILPRKLKLAWCLGFLWSDALRVHPPLSILFSSTTHPYLDTPTHPPSLNRCHWQSMGGTKSQPVHVAQHAATQAARGTTSHCDAVEAMLKGADIKFSRKGSTFRAPWTAGYALYVTVSDGLSGRRRQADGVSIRAVCCVPVPINHDLCADWFM